MSRIEHAFKQLRRVERGEPHPTALHKIAEEFAELKTRQQTRDAEKEAKRDTKKEGE
jgi:hypothetical protein